MRSNLCDEKEQDIRPLLSRLYNAASDFMESTYKRDARINWEFYNGTLPRPSHNSMVPAVDRTVYSMTETVLKDLVEIFTGGEDCLAFAPLSNEDAYTARAATQIVNQIFLRNQNGKSLLQDALKTALVERSAIIKAYWADDEYETHTVHEENLPNKEEIELYILGLREAGFDIADESVEIIENKEGTFDVTVTYRILREYVKCELLPMEEFGIEPGTKNIFDSSYMYHRVLKTKEQLKEYGLTDEELSAINDDESDLSGWVVNAARSEFRQNKDDENGVDSDDPSFRVWVKEHYWRTGVLSDDGSVRLYKLLQVGEGKIVRVDEIFSYPFYVLNPIPTPNNVFGMSYVSTIADLQCDKAWQKQTLHTYAHNAAIPSWQVVSQQFKGGDLMNPKPGAIYQVETPGAIQPLPLQPMPPLDSLLSLIDKDKEERTGVNAGVQGLSSSGIETNRSSEATINNMITLATGRVRQMAHSICNGGYSDLFLAIYNLYKDNSTRAIPVLTAYGIQDIHPSQLPDRSHLVTNVALTSQEKLKKAANLNSMIDFVAKVSAIDSDFMQSQHKAWLIAEYGNSVGFANTYDYSAPLQQIQPRQPDPMVVAQIQSVNAQTQYYTAQANKLVADDHHRTEENLFKQQLASTQEARADKELEFKIAQGVDLINFQNNQLALEANVESLKSQHNTQRQAVEEYKAQTANLKVQGNIIQEEKKLKSSPVSNKQTKPIIEG